MHNASDSEGRRMLDTRNQNMTDWMGKLSESPGSSAAFPFFLVPMFFFFFF